MIEVRQEARHIVLDTIKNIGNNVLASLANSVKERLRQILSDKGYIPISYSADPEVTAYVNNSARTFEDLDRTEPLLIDDGGALIDNVPVLRIVIRDANRMNKHLHDLVISIMNEQGVVDPKNGMYLPSAPGTVVFALKRN